MVQVTKNASPAEHLINVININCLIALDKTIQKTKLKPYLNSALVIQNIAKRICKDVYKIGTALPQEKRVRK